MSRDAGRWLWRLPLALLALAIPGLAGIGYLAAFGAPSHMVAINAGALVAGLALIAFAPPVRDPATRRYLALALLGVLALPLVIGLEVDGVARWIPVGGFNLHAGMLLLPLLCSLAALDRQQGPWLMLAALLVSLAQPDMASCLALAFASARLLLVESDWRMAALAVLSAAASFVAGLYGAIPPQPYVEGVLQSVWQVSPPASLALFASLAASFYAILWAGRGAAGMLTALAGVLAGFFLAAWWGPYPYPLIGYGAAPILGFALALSFGRAPEHPAHGEWLKGDAR